MRTDSLMYLRFFTRDDTYYNPLYSFLIVVQFQGALKPSICLPSYIYSLYMNSYPHPLPVLAAQNNKIQNTFSS